MSVEDLDALRQYYLGYVRVAGIEAGRYTAHLVAEDYALEVARAYAAVALGVDGVERHAPQGVAAANR